VNPEAVRFREQPAPDDPRRVREILESAGFFYPFEVDVAVELVETGLEHGPESGYHFIFAETDGRLVGYTCFGSIPCTVGSFDLYWIGVHDDYRGQGIGKILLHESERRIAAMSGRAVYIETASRPQYLPTREFYLRTGYSIEAVLKDYYAPGDDKVIFVKRLSG
jgi:ribosomal protein S18 acetylase RimI-like enzyme